VAFGSKQLINPIDSSQFAYGFLMDAWDVGLLVNPLAWLPMSCCTTCCCDCCLQGRPPGFVGMWPSRAITVRLLALASSVSLPCCWGTTHTCQLLVTLYPVQLKPVDGTVHGLLQLSATSPDNSVDQCVSALGKTSLALAQTLSALCRSITSCP